MAEVERLASAAFRPEQRHAAAAPVGVGVVVVPARRPIPPLAPVLSGPQPLVAAVAPAASDAPWPLFGSSSRLP